MKRIMYLMFLVNCLAVIAQNKSQPKLVILIGVDQFGASYLIDYNEVFTGGFRRMMDEGIYIQKALVDHTPTLSLPGHSTLVTGCNPKTHGITGNAWVDSERKYEEEVIHATIGHYDTNTHIVGETGHGFSSKNMEVDGLTNWVKANDQQSKAVALSVSALSPIYGGRVTKVDSSNHVYWLGNTGRFITSDYYRKDYPQWISSFNHRMAETYMTHRSWENTIPEKYWSLARQDSASYEFDGVNVTFPHMADKEIKDTSEASFNRWFGNYSPFQNDALFDLAKTAISANKLGQRESVDFLALAIKLTDRIGHDFGPKSLEQLDVVTRLDRLLGEFLTYLDDTVGEGNYVVALSADHGSPNVTEYEQSKGNESIRVTSDMMDSLLSAVKHLAGSYSGNPKQLPGIIAKGMEAFPFISHVLTEKDIKSNKRNDPYFTAFRNSYRTDRIPTYPLWTKGNQYGMVVSSTHPSLYGIVSDLAYQANIWSAASTHGGSHLYDREVPVLFFGAGLNKLLTTEQVYTRDVAPTLASLCGIPIPAYVDGKVLILR